MLKFLSWFKTLSSFKKIAVIIGAIFFIVLLPIWLWVSSIISFVLGLLLFFLVLTQPMVREKVVDKLSRFRIPGIASNENPFTLAAVLLAYLLAASIAFWVLGRGVNQIYHPAKETSEKVTSKTPTSREEEVGAEKEELATVKVPAAETEEEIKPSKERKQPIQESAKVIRVIDGDVIVVLLNGREEKVRLIGIDAPERGQPYFEEAANKTKELVLSKYVRFEKDVSERDKYGRLLRYVYIGSVFVNAELVKLGYASVYIYPPDTKYRELFRGLAAEAKEKNLGLWTTP